MARRRKSASRAHARHTTALATRPNVVVVRSGGGGGKRRRGPSRAVVVRTVKRGGRAAVKHGLPMTGLALGGAIVGYAQAAGWLDSLPELGGSKTLAMGAAGYLATRMTHNKYVREMGAAAVAVAAFEFGREHGADSHPAARGAGKVHGWGGGGGGVGPFGGA
jgi:hypothetical protein